MLSAVGGAALPFALGFAFREGDVPAGSTVVAGSGVALQATVKNVWPDGSAKTVVLAGTADLQPNTWRTVTLSVAAPGSAGPSVSLQDLRATGVTASISFGSYGTVTWSGTDWDAPHAVWISGPQMSSWVYRRPIGSDAHLVAWLEVRCYRGGRVELLPWIENGYLTVSAPGERSGTATFSLNAAPRFSQSLSLRNHQRAVLASGSTLTHWVGGDPQVIWRHDVQYLQATKLVPLYRGATRASSPLYGRLVSQYTPLAQANFPSAMGSAGYDPSIGLLPEWDVAYLTTGGDPRALRAVIINGYAAGRYGTHFRDQNTQRPARISQHPDLVLEGSSGVVGTGSSSTNTYTPAASGATPPSFASSHQPSIGYMAYLLTGWRYFLEEAQFVASVNLFKQSNTTRQRARGIIETSAGANTTRGAAWSLRAVAQAAAISPDDDPLRDEFATVVGENVAYYHGRYVAAAHNPLGLTHPYSSYNGTANPWTSASWMEDFLTGVFGYAWELKVTASGLEQRFRDFLAWKYRSIVGRLGGSGAGEFSYRYAAQYTVPYAPSASSNWSNGSGPWYGSWGEVARVMGLSTSGEMGQSLVSGYPEEATSYWGNLMPAIAYAVDFGAAGAVEGWNRILSASNWPQQAARYDDDPVWGVRPRSR